MIYKIPPKSWSKRQAILILDSDSAERLYEQPDGREIILDRELCVLTPPFDRRNKIVRDLIDNALDKPGIMLGQNPFYRNRYEDVLKIPQKFAIEKYFIFSSLCRFLGAKEVIIKEIEKNTDLMEEILRFDGEIYDSEFDSNLIKEKNDEVYRKLDIRLTFKGEKPDIEEAKSLLQRTHLINAPEMYSLIEMRKGQKNPLQSSRFVLNLSDETNNILQFIGNLRIPRFLTKIKTNYDKIVSEKKEYKLTLLVKF